MFAKGSESILGSSLFLTLFTAVLAFYNLIFLPVLFFLTGITILLMIFFRDFERTIPENGLVSPADGIVDIIENRDNKTRISIFMNIHNCHVNRAPIDGTIKKIEYFPGRFYPAYSRKSNRNERKKITLETEIGEIQIIQIAGLFARRIITYIQENQKLQRGERFGMIRFGSRVELILPSNKISILVEKKSKVYAGVTIIGKKVENSE